ncbi:MAG: hypothetical protein MJ130_03660, partial [Lachnospiraceae bacterium]|nr:hypothetical protein [Lachnospiraceae bacterium]
MFGAFLVCYVWGFSVNFMPFQPITPSSLLTLGELCLFQVISANPSSLLAEIHLFPLKSPNPFFILAEILLFPLISPNLFSFWLKSGKSFHFQPEL